MDDEAAIIAGAPMTLAVDEPSARRLMHPA
jgi:hypothetical protein